MKKAAMIPVHYACLLVKYFLHELEEEVTKELDDWISASKENHLIFEELLEQAISSPGSEINKKISQKSMPVKIAKSVIQAIAQKISRKRNYELENWITQSPDHLDIYNYLIGTQTYDSKKFLDELLFLREHVKDTSILVKLIKHVHYLTLPEEEREITEWRAAAEENEFIYQFICDPGIFDNLVSIFFTISKMGRDPLRLN